MGCGASSSVIEYAQVAPSVRGGMRRRGSVDDDEVVEFGSPHLPTPVMDRFWNAHKNAMSTADIKEFMALLGLKTKDMQGGMRVFTKVTKGAGISVEKVAAMLRLPLGASGQMNPLLLNFFKAMASTSADGASQGLTYRTFMFFHAVFKHAPLANAEKIRFWHHVMKQGNDPSADLNESTPMSVVCRFLRDVLCSKCSGFDSYLPRAPSKVPYTCVSVCVCV